MTVSNRILHGTQTEIRAQILDPVQFLDPRERIFVEHVALGATQLVAAEAAGYQHAKKLAYRILKRPHVARAVKYLADEHRKAANMDRKKVMQGFLDAIEMAKVQAEPATMVNGWREIGKMCGLYEPEKKTVDVNISGKRMIAKLEMLTTEELFELAAESEAVDAEFEEVPGSGSDQTA